MAEHIHTILESLPDSFQSLTYLEVHLHHACFKDAKDNELNLSLDQFMFKTFLNENFKYFTIHGHTRL